jgi:CheY-like chemotaxis protein
LAAQSGALQSVTAEGKIPTQGDAMKILLVEDDTEIAGHVRHALTAAGHDVESAADGQLGLSRALSGDYAALILDRMLPGLDGLSVTKQLRAHGNETPILLITTMTGIDDRVEGWKAAPTIIWSNRLPLPNCWRGSCHGPARRYQRACRVKPD